MPETRIGAGDGNYCAIRAAFLLVFLLAGFIPVLHPTTGALLFNNCQLSSLRNLAGRLTGRDVCDQLADLLACVTAWNRRVLLATFWVPITCAAASERTTSVESFILLCGLILLKREVR